MLNGFAQILETFAMDDDALVNAGVAVSGITIDGDDAMLIEMEDTDGNKKIFRLTEYA